MANFMAKFPALAAIEQAPFAQLLGLTIESAGEGEAVARLPCALRLLNSGGAAAPIHGGAIATLADFAGCAAIWTMPETLNSATVTLTLNYTGPGISSDLLAHARVRRKGRSVAHLTVEIHDDHGALVADALIVYKIA